MENLIKRSHILKPTVQHASDISQADTRCYNTKSSNRGIVNILKLGIPEFIADSIPPDTFDIDAKNLKEVFAQIGLTVFMHSDRKSTETVLKAFAEDDKLLNADIAILYILGHGERTDGREFTFTCDDYDKMYYDDIIESFGSSLGSKFEGKPKILFFEIGREDDADYTIRLEFNKENDMLIVFSTVPIRADWYTSLFVPIFCKELETSAHKDDLIRILENVIYTINEKRIQEERDLLQWPFEDNEMPMLYFNPGIFQDMPGNICQLKGRDEDEPTAGDNINRIDTFGATKLHHAASEGDLFNVKTLLNMEENKYIQDCTYFAPIHCAIEERRIEICKLLCENDTDIEEKYKRDDGMNLLHIASYVGDIQIADWLLSKDFNINSTDKNGWTCLHYAAYGGHLEMVRFLTSKEADLVKAGDETTPLHCAIKGGHLTICEEFLKDKGAEVLGEENLIQLASINGQIETVEWILLKEGVDIESKDSYQWTALHHAAYHGHMKLVKYLLKSGAKKDAADDTNYTPLHCAVRTGQLHIAKILLEESVNIDEKYALSDDGMTLLNLASIVGFTDIFEWLQSKGSDVNYPQTTDWTCLHKAALKGHLEIVQMLLAAGAKVDASNEYSYTPLQYAVSEGHVNVFKLLADDKLDVNVDCIHDGLSLLHLAATNGHVEMTKCLLTKGADINKRSINESTAVHYAASRDRFQYVQFLSENGAKIDERNAEGLTPFQDAAKKNRVETVKWFLSKGINLNSADKNGWTSLHHAANAGTVEVVQLLIENGADTNIENNKHLIPLHYAVSRGNLDVFTLLFDKTKVVSDYDVKNTGVTLLHLAAKNGQIEMAKTLLQEDSDVEKTTKMGWSALHYACNRGHLEMVKFLIEKAGNKSVRSSSCNKMPYDFAARNGHKDICDYLDLVDQKSEI